MASRQRQQEAADHPLQIGDLVGQPKRVGRRETEDLGEGAVAIDAHADGVGTQMAAAGQAIAAAFADDVAFAGDAPENRLKGQWPVPDSPLALALTEAQVTPAPLAPREALAPPDKTTPSSRCRMSTSATSRTCSVPSEFVLMASSG